MFLLWILLTGFSLVLLMMILRRMKMRIMRILIRRVRMMRILIRRMRMMRILMRMRMRSLTRSSCLASPRPPQEGLR